MVTVTYEAPAGKLGEWIAWALGEEPSIQIADDLRRFKMSDGDWRDHHDGRSALRTRAAAEGDDGRRDLSAGLLTQRSRSTQREILLASAFSAVSALSPKARREKQGEE